MKINKYLILPLIAACSVSSCNYMDYNDETDLTENFVLSRIDYSRRLATEIYGCIPSGYNALGGGMFASATDDAEHSNDLSNVQKFYMESVFKSR